MKRGDIWIGHSSRPYLSKPRPLLIVQHTSLFPLPSVVICPLSSHLSAARVLRVALSPRQGTGLERDSVVMVDKVSAIPAHKLRQKIGSVDHEVLERVASGLSLLLAIPPN